MNGYITNIEQKTLENTKFREVLFTAKHCQLTVMHINAGEDIGEEVHDVDQFLRIEEGVGKAVLDGVSGDIEAGSVVIVPTGVKHNIINTSDSEPLKLYTLYAPPHHRDKVIHETKADALTDTEHFDGKTSEGVV